MGWSISPDTGLVSIDQNGLLTYQEHTATTIYTISYSDDEGCSATKTVTLNKCISCDCSDLTVTGKTDISKDSGDNVTIGTFSKASCMSNPRASSSTSWLSNLSVSGNDIKATVEANSESSSRNGSVTVTVDKDGGGTCDKTMSITQQAGGGGDCPFPSGTIQLMLQIKYHKGQNFVAYILSDEVIGTNCIDTVMNKGQGILFDAFSVEEPNYGSFGYCQYAGCISSHIEGQYIHILPPGETGTDCRSVAEVRNDVTFGTRLIVSGLYTNEQGKWQAMYLGDIIIPTSDKLQEQAEQVSGGGIIAVFSDSNNP